MSVGQLADQRRFAGIGEADQSKISGNFEFLSDGFNFPFDARGEFAGGLVNGGFPMRVAQSSPTATGDHQFRPRLKQVAEQGLGFFVPGFGTDGHRDFQVGSIFTVLVVAPAGAPGFRALMWGKIEALKGINLRGRLQDDMPPQSPIPTIGATIRNVFLTAKVDTTVPAITGGGKDLNAIDELPYFHLGAGGFDNRYLASGFIEADHSGFQRKKSVIASNFNITPGIKFCAALAHDDAAGWNGLAGKTLHAQTLSGAVATVACLTA
jgi:hypothetical protein